MSEPVRPPPSWKLIGPLTREQADEVLLEYARKLYGTDNVTIIDRDPQQDAPSPPRETT